MIRLKNADQIGRIRESCVMLSGLLAAITPLVQPGVATQELDRFTEDYIVSRGGRPAFLGYEGYPASICISPNEVVIHGIPGKRKLLEGDVVGLDCGIDLGGYYSDAAITLPVGKIAPELEALLGVTRECLDRAHTPPARF